jgi:hypothetical protein
MEILGDLPPEHPLRNLGLARIGAEYQWVGTNRVHDWHRVTKHFKIAETTFNELSVTWTKNYRWRVVDAAGA